MSIKCSKNMRSQFANILGILLIGSFSNQGFAASYTACTSNIADNVTGSISCQISSEDQDFLNTTPLTVNQAPGFFSNTNWAFGGKIGENAGYTGVGTGQSGTYDFSSVFSNAWDDVMLVFKDGQATTLVGYLLAGNVSSGSWSSPFEYPSPFSQPGNSSNPGAYDVSHISVYYTTGEGGGGGQGGQIPEPGVIALLGIGFMGIGLSARKNLNA